MYYIKETEPGLFTVGCDIDDNWVPHEDCKTQSYAQRLCMNLNGGKPKKSKALGLSPVERAFQIYLAVMMGSPELSTKAQMDRTWAKLRSFEQEFNPIQVYPHIDFNETL